MTRSELDIKHLEDYVLGIYNSFQIDREQYTELTRLIVIIKNKAKENV